MIVMFTDFGLAGPYIGQARAVLYREAPGVPVIDLFADAPAAKPKPAAYLLAAYGAWFPAGTVFLAVVDPGVGGMRRPVVVEADGRVYVGPDNGLFELVLRRAGSAQSREIRWRPPSLSATFHGRDLFAPVAARLARGGPTGDMLGAGAVDRHPDWPDDLPEIIYIDGYGNAITGLRAAILSGSVRFTVGRQVLARARTFSDVRPGAAFWYENSNGLAEIAVNGGRADQILGLGLGTAVEVAAG